MTPPALNALFRTLSNARSEASDADLLVRLAARDDRAFADLLGRYGRLVWAACLSLTRSDADAEDAFQATFLVLLENAGKVRTADQLSSWLHGVAHKVCSRARRTARRRATRERVVAPREGAGYTVPESAWDRARAAVHEEVARLPEALRVPFVMCCLEGAGTTEAAARLGWKVGTLSGRLTRAKDAVLARLEARGLALGCAAAVGAAAVPATVSAKAAALVRAGTAVPDSIRQLSRGVIRMSMMSGKALAAVPAIVLAIPLLAACLPHGTRAADGGPPSLAAGPVPSVTPPAPSVPAVGAKASDPRLDHHLAEWETAMAGVKSLYAEIALKRTDAALETEREYTGAVSCMKPNFGVLRLDDTGDKTNYEACICDGKSLYAYSGKDKTITETKLPAKRPFDRLGVADNPVFGFFTGVQAKRLKERYDVTLIKTDEYYIYLDLKPRRKEDQQELKRVRVALFAPGAAPPESAHLPAAVNVLKPTYLPAAADVYRPNGSLDTWKFKNVQANIPGLAEKNFAFVPIAGWKRTKAPEPEKP